VLDAGLQFLHDALEDPLGAGPVDLDLDPRVRRLEELSHLLGGGERQRRVPDDLAFLARRLHPRILGGRGDGGEHQTERDEARDAADLCHPLGGGLCPPSEASPPDRLRRRSRARTSISPKVSSETVYAVSDSVKLEI